MSKIKKLLPLLSDDDRKYVPMRLHNVPSNVIDTIYFMMTHNYDEYTEKHKYILRNIDVWIFLYKKSDILEEIKKIVKEYNIENLGLEHKRIVQKIFS
jgi:hypothetical protein